MKEKVERIPIFCKCKHKKWNSFILSPFFLLEGSISSLSPFLEHKTHAFQGLAGCETPYCHDAEPSERSASSSAQVLVCTAAYHVPLAEVVAAIKHHADMAA